MRNALYLLFTLACLPAVPVLLAGTARAQSPLPADTLPPPGVVEQAVEIATPDIVLPGTITLPEGADGPVPVVVMVAGSGPTDRNGNGPLVQTNTYALIAWGLAERGVASLRYDKRGLGVSGLTIDHSKLTVDDYANDAALAIALVQEDPRFSRVYALGHSEGAMLVLKAANHDAAVDGIVMMSGAGRRLSEIVHDQLAQQTDAATLAQIDAAWSRFLLGEDPGPVPPIAAPLFVPVYRRFLQSMDAYDPAAELARLSAPLMIVQGGMDWQVTTEDADRLRAARPDAEWLFIPEANHLFKPAESGDPLSQQALYHDPSVALVPELVPGLAAFMGNP